MKQVFRNLLSNAIKFTPSGGAVEVSIFTVNNNIQVEVKDGGPGLSVENQSKLFHNVVQFHAKAQQGGGGSGFGLWISKKISDMHGGEIGVRSDGEGDGIGSTFYFNVPLHQAAEDDKVAGATTAGVNTEDIVDAIPQESIVASILITDDSPINRKMLAKSLEADGHITYTAEDGDVAVNLVRTSLEEGEPNRYQIILMDNVEYELPL